MNETQKVLLEHLASALFGVPTESEITEEVISEALLQTVATLLPIEKYREYWNLLGHNVSVTVAHQHLHKVMTKYEIPYAVLKGVASAAYYPDPDRRQMGDVDFIVRPDDLERARKALEAEGYHGWDENHEHHICFQTDHGHWELHWRAPGIPDGNPAEKYLDDIVEQAVEYDGCMIASHFHHGLVLLAHSAVHWINSGIGLRHLCDWAVFYPRFSDDEFRLMFEKALREAGLWKYACIITAVCIKYLGSPERQWAKGISDEYITQIMEDIQSSGDFGRKDDERINQAKLMTDQASMTVKNSGMAGQLFKALSVKTQVQWPFFAKYRFLLPFGVMGIAIRHALNVIQGKRPHIHVGEMISGAQKRKTLYQQFELFQPTKGQE